MRAMNYKPKKSNMDAERLMDLYMDEMQRYPLLLLEEEQAFGRQILELSQGLDSLILATPYGRSFYFDIHEQVVSGKKEIGAFMSDRRKNLCRRELDAFIGALHNKSDVDGAWNALGCFESTRINISVIKAIRGQFYDRTSTYAVMAASSSASDERFRQSCIEQYGMETGEIPAYHSRLMAKQKSLTDVINQVALPNLRLVISIARGFRRYRGLTLLDLIQEGNMGLLEVIERFDYRKGRLVTYAPRQIHNVIDRTIIDKWSAIRVPYRVRLDIRKLNHFFAKQPDLSFENYADSIEEIREKTGLSKDQIKAAASAWKKLLLFSLDHGYHTESNVNKSRAPEQLLEQKQIAALVTKTMDAMPDPREKLVLLCRCGLDMELKEIASSLLEVSRQRVKQIEDSAKANFSRVFARICRAHCPESGLTPSDLWYYFENFRHSAGRGFELDFFRLYEELVPQVTPGPRKRQFD